ncbi:MAG: type II toxin-antitoxin system VapC family toxin [Chloroflexota bacterium]
MITAIDTSVLLDVFGADADFGTRSLEALRSATRDGRLTACEVVWAEVTVFFTSAQAARAAMDRLGVEFDPMTVDAATRAGAAWRRYRERGGRRERVVSDFLIGAHAIAQAERLLTRDRGFYRSYFSQLRLTDPASS